MLKEHFEGWQSRPLQGEGVIYRYLDALGVKARVGRRVASRAVLAAVEMREDGRKVLLGLWSKGLESREAWKGVLGDMEGEETLRGVNGKRKWTLGAMRGISTKCLTLP